MFSETSRRQGQIWSKNRCEHAVKSSAGCGLSSVRSDSQRSTEPCAQPSHCACKMLEEREERVENALLLKHLSFLRRVACLRIQKVCGLSSIQCSIGQSLSKQSLRLDSTTSSNSCSRSPTIAQRHARTNSCVRHA